MINPSREKILPNEVRSERGDCRLDERMCVAVHTRSRRAHMDMHMYRTHWPLRAPTPLAKMPRRRHTPVQYTLYPPPPAPSFSWTAY